MCIRERQGPEQPKRRGKKKFLIRNCSPLFKAKIGKTSTRAKNE